MCPKFGQILKIPKDTPMPPNMREVLRRVVRVVDMVVLICCA